MRSSKSMSSISRYDAYETQEILTMMSLRRGVDRKLAGARMHMSGERLWGSRQKNMMLAGRSPGTRHVAGSSSGEQAGRKRQKAIDRAMEA